MAALGLKLNDYWREKKEKKAKERAFRALERKYEEGTTEDGEDSDTEEEEMDEENKADVTWIQCEDCLKWRGIASHLFSSEVPECFTCSQHPVGRLRSCLVPEEAEEPEDELTPSYEKTHKKQEQCRLRRRGKPVEGNKGHERREIPRSPSEPTPDEAVISMETETESRSNKSSTATTTEPTQSHSNKRKAECLNHEIGNKSPKATDVSTERLRPSTEEEQQEKKSPKKSSSEELTLSSVNENDKTSPETPVKNSAANPSPAEQVLQGPQVKEQTRLSTGLPGWPHPINPHTSMAWSHPLPPAQTVVVPPLSRTSRQPLPQLPLEGLDRSVLTVRLDQLEREAKRLRRILGLREAVVQMAPLTEGESGVMVLDRTINSGVETAVTVPMASKKSGQQSDKPSPLKKNCSSAGQQEAPADDLNWNKTVARLQSQNQTLCADLSKLKRERDELQNKLKQTERETLERKDQSTSTPSSIHEGITMEKLRSIRRNVVSLLSSILPNLDMQGISYDTGDVDSILQQIIQANNL